MVDVKHLSPRELEAGLGYIRRAPRNHGRLELIVRRPHLGERELLDEGELDLLDGLVGDSWRTRGCPLTADGLCDPERQVTVMNVRAAALVAVEPARRPLAGDQLYIDLDISEDNLPPRARLTIGSAVLEVTAPPHTGCKKFTARFGIEAMKFVNSPVGRRLRLRGMNTRVIQRGVIRVGDAVYRAGG
jgi:hypothetical protein